MTLALAALLSCAVTACGSLPWVGRAKRETAKKRQHIPIGTVPSRRPCRKNAGLGLPVWERYGRIVTCKLRSTVRDGSIIDRRQNVGAIVQQAGDGLKSLVRSGPTYGMYGFALHQARY